MYLLNVGYTMIDTYNNHFPNFMTLQNIHISFDDNAYKLNIDKKCMERKEKSVSFRNPQFQSYF